MRERIVALAIEASFLDANNEYFNHYMYELNAYDKINKVADAILNAYQQAYLQYPDASQFIIVWSEHLICEDVLYNKAISASAKDYLLEKLSSVVNKCPKLLIASGSTLIQKEILPSDRKEKIKEIINCYQENKWAQDVEAEYNEVEFQKHYQDAVDIYATEELFKHIYFTKNVSFFVTPTTIERHGKTCPISENSVDTQYPFLFQPGKKESKHVHTPIHTLKNGFNIVKETCREHPLGYAKWLKEKYKQIFHFQICNSNYCNVILKNMVAEFGLLHIDSMNGAEFVLPFNHKMDQIDFVLFRYNLFSKHPVLEGPVAPIRPLQFQMIDLLSQKVNEFCQLFPFVSDNDFFEKLINHINGFPGLRFNQNEIDKMNEILEDYHATFFNPSQLKNPAIQFLNGVVESLTDLFNNHIDSYFFHEPVSYKMEVKKKSKDEYSLMPSILAEVDLLLDEEEDKASSFLKSRLQSEVEELLASEDDEEEKLLDSLESMLEKDMDELLVQDDKDGGLKKYGKS